MKKDYAYMPILKTGTFTDKNNQTVKITEEHLDHMIASFNPEQKAVNLVIDHPTFDEIGFGSVKKLKRAGEYLLALPEKVSDKLKDAVNKGKLPFRSSTINKSDFTLKNISFLPPEKLPAVDGLGSYAFSAPDDESVLLHIKFEDDESHFAEADNDKIEFAKYEASQWPFKSLEKIVRNIKNWLIEKEGKDEADKIINEYELDDIGKPPRIFEVTPGSETNLAFSKPKKIESDMKLTDEQIAKLQKDNEALKTANTDLTNKLDAANTTLEFSALKSKRDEAEKFVNSDEMKKRITPAIKDEVIDTMVALDNNGVFEFAAAQGEEPKKVDAQATFKKMLGMLPELDLDVELAKGKREENTQMTEAQKFGKEAAAMVND